MNEKIRSWVKECFCFLERCETITFSYFDKFSHFTYFDELKILRNSITILSNLINLTQTLTLSLSPCSPKPNCANEAQGVKNEGLYSIYRRSKTQGSPNKWFIILRKHYITFTLATINAPFWYPTLADR